MPNRNDPEIIKIPAFMRKHAIVSQARQKLILTALDRKEAGVSVHSKKATAPLPTHKPVPQGRISATPRRLKASVRRTYVDEVEDMAPVRSRIVASVRERVPSGRVSPIEEIHESPSLFTKKIPHIGTITHYLEKIDVAIIKLTAPLKAGETILFEGDGFMYAQPVEEMQIDRKPVNTAKKGSHIGVKVQNPAHVNGKVYRLPS